MHMWAQHKYLYTMYVCAHKYISSELNFNVGKVRWDTRIENNDWSRFLGFWNEFYRQNLIHGLWYILASIWE